MERIKETSARTSKPCKPQCTGGVPYAQHWRAETQNLRPLVTDKAEPISTTTEETQESPMHPIGYRRIEEKLATSVVVANLSRAESILKSLRGKRSSNEIRP